MSETHHDPFATDRKLLEAVSDPANHPAWGIFIDRYRPMVRGWCRCWFPGDAEDMAWEVFTHLVLAMRSFEYRPELGRFRGWLKTVTHRFMAELKRDRGPVLLDPEVLDDVQAREDLEARLAAEDELELAEQAMEIVRRRVEDHTWSAFYETAVNGRRADEVARQLGMKVGTVYQAKHSVQKALKREIEILEAHG